MRKIAHLAPAALFTLALAAGCKDETPPNEPGEFGDPCLVGEPDDSPNGCQVGLSCYFGYCEETCAAPSDCRPIDGREHTCAMGVCHIQCDANVECPADLGTALVCGNDKLCEAEEPS